MEVPLHHLGEQRRRLRARLSGVHRGGRAADHAGRTAYRPPQPKERGRRAARGGRSRLGRGRRLGGAVWLHPSQLLHGHRRLVAVLLLEVRGVDARRLPG